MGQSWNLRDCTFFFTFQARDVYLDIKLCIDRLFSIAGIWKWWLCPENRRLKEGEFMHGASNIFILSVRAIDDIY